ncbi:hypothetical protein F4604DRAFT_1921631 [Suillus subluteus]|nr:hypothetical protein F4604DRAFT_1921631 [Suillus subluteus]
MHDTGRHIFHSIVKNACPFFKLANDGWKLDHLAGTSYPAWRRTHLGDEGNWKSKKDGDESDEENGDSHKGKKCKQLSSSIQSEVVVKRIKVDIASPPLPSATPLPIELPIGAPPVQAEVVFATPPPVLPSLVPTLSPPILPLINLPFEEDKLASPELPPLISLAEPHINEENISIETICIASPRPIKITITNPLLVLTLAAANVNLPPPLKPDPEDPMKTSSIEMGTMDHTPKATATGSKVKSGGKVVKMSLLTIRLGNRNLCAHCWLRKVKSNGTTEEFCNYYGSLTLDQRKKYNDEATQLVSDNSWTSGKSVCDSQLY